MTYERQSGQNTFLKQINLQADATNLCGRDPMV